jgi:hypothetical protein
MLLVVVAKYHDLEQANTKVFSEQFQPDGLLNYKGGSDNGAYQSSCIVARSIFPGFSKPQNIW